MTTKSKLPDHEIERIKNVVPTIDELRIIDLMRDYRVVRNRYFGESIPPVEEVFIKCIPQGEMDRASDDDGAVGFCLAGKDKGSVYPYVIGLSDSLSACERRITLLHEMAHLKINRKFRRVMGHGEKWKKEMRRLAAAGAFDNWW